MGDTAFFALTKGISSANSKFFKELKGKAIQIAAEESRKMAEDIVQIIKNRQDLEGYGNFPQWDGSNGVKSKMSAKNWAVVPMGANHYAVKYSEPSAEDSYVGLLVNGLTFANSDHVWHKSFYNVLKNPRADKNFVGKLTSNNGRLFSTQMPQGLDPFLKVKRKQLQDRIEVVENDLKEHYIGNIGEFLLSHENMTLPEKSPIYSVNESYQPKWDQSLADHIIDCLAQYAPNIKDRIVHRQVLTPMDWEQTYGLTEGSIFHGQMGLDQLLVMRPVPGWGHYRTPIRNLFLCGAGTHPGGGVTGAPGYNAARVVLKTLQES